MTENRHELWQLLDKIQMDHRQMGQRIVEARAALAALNLPDPETHTCPNPLCRVTFRSRYRLAEHVHNSHGGPIPEHILAVEAIADEPVESLLTDEDLEVDAMDDEAAA